MRSILFVSFFLLSWASMAQIELGYCEQPYDDKTQEQVNKALKALNAKNLPMARIYVNNVLEIDPENAHGLYLQGELALKEKNIPKAMASWDQLIKVCPNYLAEIYFFMGMIYMEEGKDDQAAKMLKTYLQNPERDRYFDKEAEKTLKEAKLKKVLLANPVEFDPEPVRSISTPADEYLAIISPDGDLCFFTRRQKKVNKYDGPGRGSRVVEEFTMARRQGDQFTIGEALSAPFNQNYNEGGPSITANNRELYFTVCTVDKSGYQNCDIYYTKMEFGKWSEIKSIGDHINREDSWESQPSVNANGTELFFTSNRAGGHGGLDLYVVHRKEDGSWTSPENLGSTINTYKNEKSPFIHSDSQTLYFASEGLPGLGGFDIYYSKFDKEKGWDEPINIGYPINTNADELGLFVSLNGKTAYFNSNKLKGPGGWDLYAFELHSAARPEKVALVKGVLTDENKLPDPEAKLEIKNLKTKEVTRIDVDEQSGEFAAVVRLKDQEDLILKVKKKGAAFNSKLIDADVEASKGDAVVQVEMEASPIATGKEYRLNDINFETNSFDLNENAKLVIEEFRLFLLENPNVKVDIQGHTDNVGADEDNRILSQNRARVVYEYLLQSGIPSSRMTYHGFGETRPIDDNSIEEGRAKNRRTVFVITDL
ncbi:MAG: OmpA family protein [Bacteroidota bacterium]|nr:OmpA family protein [Bacteroidota bacterium]